MDDHWLIRNHQRGLLPLSVVVGIRNADVAEAKAVGNLSWWTNDQLHVEFWRPLALISHWLDFVFWPEAWWLMRLQNALLYALLVGFAASCYRLLARAQQDGAQGRALPAWIAVAGLMFALDDAHAQSVGWLTARNSVMAALLALVSFWCHLRSRAQGWEPGRWLSPLALVLALAAAEAGVQGMAYLVAYALLLDRAPLQRRIASLVPHAAVILIWGAYYASHGYGARGSDFYRSLRPDPLHTVGAALWDVPLWLGSQLIASVAMPSLFADNALTRVIWCVLLACIVPLLLGPIRSSPLARFFALSMALCFVPLLLTRPQDRLTLSASFGGFGLLALALSAQKHSLGYRRWARRALYALHLGIAPLLFYAGLGLADKVDIPVRALARALPATTSDVTDMILLNLPFESALPYARALHQNQGKPLPDRTYQLYAGNSELELQRIDERTLELSASDGWCKNPLQRVFTSLTPPFHAGRSWTLPGMHVRVMHANAAGAPERVRFTFPTRLEDPKRTWFVWRGEKPEPYRLPALGETRRIAALPALTL